MGGGARRGPVSQYPSFMPFGFNGGLDYIRAIDSFQDDSTAPRRQGAAAVQSATQSELSQPSVG